MTVAPVVSAELPARPPRRSLPEIGASRRVAPGRVLAVASAGAGLAFVDATIVNVAFPDMQADFAGTSLSALSWILNAYNIVFAAFLVAAGRLADLLGRRRTFHAGVVLFTLASVACAAAPTVELLVAARVLQALGAAIVVPASLALVLAGLPAGASAPTASRCGRPARRSPPASARRSAARWSSSAAGGSRSSSTSRSASPPTLAGRRMLIESRAPGPPHAARSRRRGARRARDRRAHARDRAGGGVGLDERARARRVRRGARARHGLRAPLPLAPLADARPRPAADPHALRRQRAERRRRRGLLRATCSTTCSSSRRCGATRCSTPASPCPSGPFVAAAVARPASRLAARARLPPGARRRRAHAGRPGWPTCERRIGVRPAFVRRVAAGHARARHRRRPHVPAAERRRGRVGARASASRPRRRSARQPPARRGARRRAADRRGRHAAARRGGGGVRPRLAVLRRLHARGGDRRARARPRRHARVRRDAPSGVVRRPAARRGLAPAPAHAGLARAEPARRRPGHDRGDRPAARAPARRGRRRARARGGAGDRGGPARRRTTPAPTTSAGCSPAPAGCSPSPAAARCPSRCRAATELHGCDVLLLEGAAGTRGFGLWLEVLRARARHVAPAGVPLDARAGPRRPAPDRPLGRARPVRRRRAGARAHRRDRGAARRRDRDRPRRRHEHGRVHRRAARHGPRPRRRSRRAATRSGCGAARSRTTGCRARRCCAARGRGRCSSGRCRGASRRCRSTSSPSPATSSPASSSCTAAARWPTRSARASASPASCRRWRVDGRRLVDGGVLNNLPGRRDGRGRRGPDRRRRRDDARRAAAGRRRARPGRDARPHAHARQRRHRGGRPALRRPRDPPRDLGAGMLEFHLLDELRAEGRRAARARSPAHLLGR